MKVLRVCHQSNFCNATRRRRILECSRGHTRFRWRRFLLGRNVLGWKESRTLKESRRRRCKRLCLSHRLFKEFIVKTEKGWTLLTCTKNSIVHYNFLAQANFSYLLLTLISLNNWQLDFLQVVLVVAVTPKFSFAPSGCKAAFIIKVHMLGRQANGVDKRRHFKFSVQHQQRQIILHHVGMLELFMSDDLFDPAILVTAYFFLCVQFPLAGSYH